MMLDQLINDSEKACRENNPFEVISWINKIVSPKKEFMLPEWFLDKYSSQLNLEKVIPVCQELSEEFVMKYRDKMWFPNISSNRGLCEKLLDEFSGNSRIAYGFKGETGKLHYTAYNPIKNIRLLYDKYYSPFKLHGCVKIKNLEVKNIIEFSSTRVIINTKTIEENNLEIINLWREI